MKKFVALSEVSFLAALSEVPEETVAKTDGCADTGGFPFSAASSTGCCTQSQSGESTSGGVLDYWVPLHGVTGSNQSDTGSGTGSDGCTTEHASARNQSCGRSDTGANTGSDYG